MASSLTIILATVIPVVVIILIVTIWLWNRRRYSRLFNRGITPIADEEIESWKNDRHDDEKVPIPEPTRRSSTKRKTQTYTRHRQQNSSISSVQKPASVIVYQNGASARPSGEQTPHSPYSRSMDLPQTPVLARAPNARPGLTDETIQGDDAFIPQAKRQPSRLSKGQHHRHRSAYSAVGASRADRWYGQDQVDDMPTRQSADNIPRRGSAPKSHDRIYTDMSNPPRMSLDDSVSPGGLSPRPLLHKSEIGRAIG